MKGWFCTIPEKPDLGIESLTFFLSLLKGQKLSGRNPSDMDYVRAYLEEKKYKPSIVEGVVWRYRNLSGLC